MKRLIVGLFNRVEGELELTLNIADGQVTSAEVNAPTYPVHMSMYPSLRWCSQVRLHL